MNKGHRRELVIHNSLTTMLILTDELFLLTSHRTLNAEINGILTSYNQPLNGNLNARKERLTKYPGIRGQKNKTKSNY